VLADRAVTAAVMCLVMCLSVFEQFPARPLDGYQLDTRKAQAMETISQQSNRLWRGSGVTFRSDVPGGPILRMISLAGTLMARSISAFRCGSRDGGFDGAAAYRPPRARLEAGYGD